MKAILITLLLAFGFAGFALWSMDQPVGGTGSALFPVAKGDGVADIAAHLQDAHLIRSAAFFKLTAWSRGDRGAFKAGSFELAPSMTTRQIEAALASDKPVSDERDFTVIEGWTLRDISGYFQKEDIASPDAFAAVAGVSAKPATGLPDWAASFPILADKPATASLEGYLFPDTYRIYKNSDASAVVRRMLAGMEAKFTPDMRAQAAAQGHSIFQVLTMASVLEREVRSDADRATVADIFWRRVKAGAAMQADSTVNYCTGKSQASVSAEDIKTNCLWNTYKWKGLPIGPIGNPGLASIQAALNPSPNTYWYFLTDAEGNVHYAKTLDEHNANKRKYLN